jgi:MFS family permease
MQIPSNMVINRIPRPSIYISVVMLIWGMISTLSGNTSNFAGMVAVRFFIGFVEAAFLPGALLILSKWYTRRELTLRNAILFCGNLISNAFSSLVGAAVLGNMEGALGHRAWRWLYWIEGAATMAIAIAAIFILPDLPHNSRGFTEEERSVAVWRMTEDVGEADEDSAEQSPWTGLIMAVKDLKIYVMMFTFTAYVIGLSFNAFFPSLTRTLGFGYITTLLMSAPPWAFACLISLANAWHADKTQERFWHIVGPIIGGLVGFIISMSTLNTAARYVALFLQASSYAGFIVFYSWISSSFPRPPAKRAVAIAMINAFSQLGNICGSYVWNMKANGYRNSYGVVTAMFGVTIAGCYAFRVILVRLNKRLDDGTDAWVVKDDIAEQTAKTEGVDVEEGARKMQDFRYLI